MKRNILLASAGTVALGLFISIFWVALILKDLPDVSVLKRYRPAAAAEVLDSEGRLLGVFSDRSFRIWVPLSSLSDNIVKAVVTAEDDTFFEHQGVNVKATWEAFIHDVKKGRFARGGSTITQQMIKNVLLSREKTISRKVREVILAYRAENILTKRQILEIYLNVVEWGENIYGIEAASRFYFDKHASELNVSEAALLAGMLPNPRYFNPFKRMDKARERQQRVLFNMFQAKHLTEEEYEAALSEDIRLRQWTSERFGLWGAEDSNGRPCHIKALEQVLLSIYGEHGLYRQGLKIRTSIDKELQDNFHSAAHLPDEVVLVMDRGVVRAIACTDETTVGSVLDHLGPPYDGYEYTVVPVESIKPEDVLLGEGGG